MCRVGYVLGALLLIAVAIGPALAQQPFSDVPTNHWAYNAVNDLAEKGLLEGYPDQTFKGKQPLTRYEFAQAIARIMDRMEQMGGIPGPPGPPGPPGTGAGALTPEQQAMLDKLAKEFAPELKALRSDLDALTKRVEDLEAKPEPAMPKITVSGSVSTRLGLYGTGFGTEDVATTGYPYYEELQDNGVVPYGGINLPFYDPENQMWSDDSDYPGGPVYMGSIPITDALKDAYKASDFMTMKTKLNFSGQLTDNVDAKVTLLAGPQTNSLSMYGPGSPLSLGGNGVMDMVTVDEAWLKYRGQFLTPVEVTVGKQYFCRGQGLLVDNNQEAVKAFRVDWTAGGFSWGAIWGMLDYEQFYGQTSGPLGLPAEDPGVAGVDDPETSGQDNYNVYMLGWNFANDWSIGGTWLGSGFSKESGWSADLKGKVAGLDLYAEYAQLLDWPTGDDFNDLNGDGVKQDDEVALDESDNAWLAGLRWNGSFVQLTGEYGQVDPGYAFVPPSSPTAPARTTLPLSRLHPNAEFDPHDINWVDRPLFLDPTNIARGWHVNVTFPTLFGGGTPLSISYMDGDAYDPRYLSWLGSGGSTSGIEAPDKWRDADSVWVVKLSRQFSENVSGNLVYGRREVDNVMSPQCVPIETVDDVDQFAEADPIQVIRAEVCVAF